MVLLNFIEGTNISSTSEDGDSRFLLDIDICLPNYILSGFEVWGSNFG
jgi:hypothetical protein